ncbi:MAG: amidohydrolase family protein [Balneolaceae bacterium]
MKHILGWFLLILVLGCTQETLPPVDITYDVKIENARVVDGTGAEAFQGSILINDGFIVYAGSSELSGYNAKESIDAKGRVVAPGFIDPHAHGNAEVDPAFRNFWSMGVTTIFLGLDGSSPGIANLPEWMEKVQQANPGVNIAHTVGHGTARRYSGIGLQRNPDNTQLDSLAHIIDTQLRDGSFGVSTGIEYIPGVFANREELAVVAEVVSQYDGLILSHIRNEDEDQVSNSIRELIQMGREGNARVHVSHIKVVFGNEVDDANRVIAVMDSARAAGVAITADVYPYAASYTGIGILYPDWALPPNNFKEVVQTRRPELAQYLRERVQRRNGPTATLIGTAPWTGKTLAQIAEELDKPFEDVLIDHLPPGSASGAYFVMNMDVMRQLLLDPHVMVSSDGSPTMEHPRGYGSFARIIRQFVEEEGVLSLEEAIYKMTGQTAELLGIDQARGVSDALNFAPRGILKPGFAADVLVFNPSNIVDKAVYEEPHQYAIGFDYVIINGEIVQQEGEFTGTRPGIMLKKR